MTYLCPNLGWLMILIPQLFLAYSILVNPFIILFAVISMDFKWTIMDVIVLTLVLIAALAASMNWCQIMVIWLAAVPSPADARNHAFLSNTEIWAIASIC
eukprot:NODE_263_length_12530_cov_0.434881.p8 type:complete len:100 gc:universal NODE_263_length_12530_cov_0.434881:8691-8392(-)